MTAQQNRAPLGCRQCGHIVLVTVTTPGRVENYDRCAHPSGPHPMHTPCAWFAQKTEGVSE